MSEKKIKVYLQYPWKFPDSPYYRYLIQNPPINIEYQNVMNQKGVITNNRFFLISNFLKKAVKTIIKFIVPSLPNAHLTPRGDYNLIHCAHCLSKNINVPWVADIEYSGQFWAMGSRLGRKNKDYVKNILRRQNCKKIVTWTNLMKTEILSEFPFMKNKVEVIYPGVPILSKKHKKHKNIVLSFVARYFYDKGGLHALEVMDRITKKYDNVRGIIVAEVPNEIRKKYSKNKFIKFYGLMPQRNLIEKVYSITDIFVYPGYSDSFGFSIPEVMGMGIPVVSVDGSSRREIISDGKNGFVVNNTLDQKSLSKIYTGLKDDESKRIIRDIIEKVEMLISNKKLLSMFSREAKKEIERGRFSIERQRKEIGRIYREALK